jgi:hypothetical protein
MKYQYKNFISKNQIKSNQIKSNQEKNRSGLLLRGMSPDSKHEQMVKIQLPEGTFRAADIVTTKRPEAVDIEKHLKYSKRIDYKQSPSGQKQWRIFACAAAPMRASAWQKLFHANKVKKIEGNFKDYKWFKQCVDTPGVVIPVAGLDVNLSLSVPFSGRRPQVGHRAI